jgi:peptide maturation system acyl carrier-related protein
MEGISMEEKLKRLIKDTLSIDISQMTEKEKEYPLLSKRFEVLPYQMLVLFTRIERDFGIRIDEEDIVAGRFNSYSDILRICEKHVNITIAD